MKTIHTLIKDIYAVVGSKDGWFDQALAQDFSREVGQRLVESIAPRDKVPALRLSKMGECCPCALWHSIHTPELAEPYEPWTLIKFTYGHILETFVIAMARAAGHEVTGEQDEVILDGVKGHRDCVIDGCVVDVKSVNSMGFQTVKSGMVAQDIFLRDYLDQLDGYVVASHADPLVKVKDKGYILAIDKVKGHLALYEHRVRPDHIRERIASHKRFVDRDEPLHCTCGTVADGKSGNIKLDLKASYNNFKYCCNPNVRKFIYAGGPVYLTKVVRLPDVREVDRYGKTVYN